MHIIRGLLYKYPMFMFNNNFIFFFISRKDLKFNKIIDGILFLFTLAFDTISLSKVLLVSWPLSGY